ncbi:uncharacterized protein [Eurosta solidaginis]|uniref:uncharacterized protein isoform X2 n=1 Tax=Eurosta solidaginis TaxID=178769 RepID=UPI0035307F26
MFANFQIWLCFVVFVFYPTVFNKCEARVNTKDISYLEVTGGALRNTTTNNNSSPAADESDILMPPIEITETIAGIADVTITPSRVNKENKVEYSHAPLWWHNYDALLMSLGVMVMFLLMAATTQCMWRRQLELPVAEWEVEITRIYSNTPCYADRSQILVY